MFTQAARKKAAQVTFLFTAFFVLSSLFVIRDWGAAIPVLLFSVLLLINTYYSIRCFASVPGAGSKPEQASDLALGVLYLLLALSLSNAQFFLLLTILLFVVATIKYCILFAPSGYRIVVKKKIVLDILCGIGCALTYGGIVLGYRETSLVLWTIVFFIGNFYVLAIAKLYTPD